MIHKYLKAIEIVKQKYQEKDSLYPLMVSSIYGLLCKYETQEDLIKNLFKETIILIEPGEINDILKRHKIETEVEEKEDSIYSTYGGSNQGNLVYINEQGEIKYQKEKPYIVCTKDVSPEDLLNTFCHEMNHLIKGEKNGFSLMQEENTFYYYLRTGLAYYCYEYQKGEEDVEYSVLFGYLDEAINTIQTTEIMESILSLKDWINDKNIKNYLDSLDEKRLKQDIGYHEITPQIRELWNTDTFKEIIEKYIIEGNIKALSQEFDSYTYEGAFEELSDCIDKIYELTEVNSKNKYIKKYQNKINNIIQRFKASIKKSYKKNFIFQ